MRGPSFEPTADRLRTCITAVRQRNPEARVVGYFEISTA
jgi:hypothetical protein